MPIGLSTILDVGHLLAWLCAQKRVERTRQGFGGDSLSFLGGRSHMRSQSLPGCDLKNFQFTAFLAASPADEEAAEPLDLSIFSGSLKHGDVDTGRNCWSIPSGHLFRVRSKRFLVDRSKVICNLQSERFILIMFLAGSLLGHQYFF